MSPRTLTNPSRLLAMFSAALLLSACGDYGGRSGNVSGGDPGSRDATEVRNCGELFTKRVQPRLDFCRSCHVPEGVADVPDGKLFQLSKDESKDAENLKASWLRLGGNGGGKSRILKMASGTDTRTHSGGEPWPVGSDAYREVDALLIGYDTPSACVLVNLGSITDLPLLGGPRGGGPLSNFCAGKADSAVLPVDPRTLIVPGVNEGKAVAFNAYWKSCDNVVARPKTCGDLRGQAELGRFVGEGQGEPGTPLSFAGGNDNPRGLPADKYNSLWDSAWGLPERPNNFDELVAERYGSPRTPWRNPYPLPGEDPNKTDGGSGQLPLVFTQIRKADGTWTGEIGQKVCIFCHNGQLGTVADGADLGPQLGGAGSIGDFAVAASDFAKAEGTLGTNSALSAVTISTNRGTGAIDFFQLAFILFSNGDPTLLLNDKIVLSKAIGNIKSPPWWNLAYRSQKFHGAILPTDSSRIDLAAYYDLTRSLSGGSEEALAWMDAHAGPFQTWAETLAPPRYPRPIDTQLAEQGAILFHSKNLWGDGLDNPVARPDKGNGSCAGCHGAYSPRYVHDPAYLDSPELAGQAAYTMPTSIAGTDPVYSEAMQSLRNADGSVSPSIMNQSVVYCGLGNAGYSESNTPIMLAPPLWGIWAAAPYFHNGSVPNIWGVLDPAKERPNIWKRHSTPAREDQVGRVIMGYDTDLDRGYDFDKLGWKYDEIPCGAAGSQPYIACNPMGGAPSPVQALLAQIYSLVGLTWNLPRPEGLRMSEEDIENRKVFNTNLYSQGNQGHAFTAVLTDQERRAIIEYLKTL